MRTTRAREEETTSVNTSELSLRQIRNLIPRKLYKYNSVTDYFLKGLEAHSLWFSSPLDFNDPFDCKVNLYYGRKKKEIAHNLLKILTPERSAGILEDEDLLRKLLSKPRALEDVLNKISHYTFGEKLGVCCFSERKDHILMWSHYAANHSGVCLQFNTARRGIIHDSIHQQKTSKELMPLSSIMASRNCSTTGQRWIVKIIY
ncbi:MAG: DUF2971 domain-containing protein [Leadbetterella sp.]|nr:DUF2971 domain-containing protein [Leadbetterella sp.]